MPPNNEAVLENEIRSQNNIAATATGILFEEEVIENNQFAKKRRADNRKLQLVWRNIIAFAYLHLGAVYGLYLVFASAKLYTNIFTYFIIIISGLGITGGAHRLWAHKSYKAKLPLRLMLVVFNTIAFQGPVIEWARDHRMHHKFTETDADPHNSERGFFFSHVGWLCCKKHPEIKQKSNAMDFSDLYNDPLLKFQMKHYMFLMPLFCFVLPTVIPVYFWSESWRNSWHIAGLLRYAYTLNVTWLVNSLAHTHGSKPYDKYMKSVENTSVSVLALGEGFHNYHHTFPWDYKVAELGDYSMNFTKAFIDLMATIGWAYDLKTVPHDLIKKRTKRTGDGSHPIWGWGDDDQLSDELEILGENK